MSLEFVSLRGKFIEDYLDDLAQVRIEVLGEFPYLYQGKYNYEKEYLKTYSESSNSLIEIVKADGKVVGFTTCIPLNEESNEIQLPFMHQNRDVKDIFYFGESLVLSKYRSHDIFREFFKRMEEHANDVLGHLESTVFTSVKRSPNHSLYTQEFKHLMSFWQELGYKEHKKLYVEYTWKDIHQKSESTKKLMFWEKKWD